MAVTFFGAPLRAEQLDDFAKQALHLYKERGPGVEWHSFHTPPQCVFRGIEGLLASVSPDSGPLEPILNVEVPCLGQWKEVLRYARTAREAETIAIERIEGHWQALYEFRLRLGDFLESKVDGEKRYRDNRGHEYFNRWVGELQRLRASRPAFELAAQAWKDFSRKRWHGGWRNFPSIWPDHTRLPHCHRDVISLVNQRPTPEYGSEAENEAALRTACTFDVVANEAVLRASVLENARVTALLGDVNALLNETVAMARELTERYRVVSVADCSSAENAIEEADCILTVVDEIGSLEADNLLIAKQKGRLRYALARLRYDPAVPQTVLEDEIGTWLEELLSVQKTFRPLRSELHRMVLKAEVRGTLIAAPEPPLAAPIANTTAEPEQPEDSVIFSSLSSMEKRKGEPLFVSVFGKGTDGRGSPGGGAGDGSGHGGSGGGANLYGGNPGGVSLTFPAGSGASGRMQSWHEDIRARSASYHEFHRNALERFPIMKEAVAASLRTGADELRARIAANTTSVASTRASLAAGAGAFTKDLARRFDSVSGTLEGWDLPRSLLPAGETAIVDAGAYRAAAAISLAASIAERRGDADEAALYRDVATVMSRAAQGIKDHHRLVLGITPGLGWAQDVYESVAGKGLDGTTLAGMDRSFAILGVVTAGIGSKAKVGLKAITLLGKWHDRAGSASLRASLEVVEKVLAKKEVFFHGVDGTKHAISQVAVVAAEVENVVLKLKHGYESPHLAGTVVHRLMGKADLPLFARVHGPNNKVGAWILRAENLRELSPLQIQKKYNLKYVPTHISDVTIPGGTIFSRGRVGPVPGLGESAGAVQYYLHTEIPAKYFSNTRPFTGRLP